MNKNIIFHERKWVDQFGVSHPRGWYFHDNISINPIGPYSSFIEAESAFNHFHNILVNEYETENVLKE